MRKVLDKLGLIVVPLLVMSIQSIIMPKGDNAKDFATSGRRSTLQQPFWFKLAILPHCGQGKMHHC